MSDTSNLALVKGLPSAIYDFNYGVNLSNALPTVNNNVSDSYGLFSPQEKLDTIASEIERRATTSYGLGHALGKYVFGTIDANENSIWQKSKAWINAYFYASPVQVQPQAVKFIALDLKPSDNITYPSIFTETVTAFNKNSLALETEINKRHIYHQFSDIQTQTQICNHLERVKTTQGPVKLLIITGHGSPTSLQLGRSNISFEGLIGRNDEESINIRELFYPTPIKSKPTLSCLNDFLDQDAIIILESCNTGGTYEFKEPYFSYPINLNMHMFIASLVPGRTVYAADYSLYMDSLQIEYEKGPYPKVTGNLYEGAGCLTEKCQEDHLIKRFIDLLHYARGKPTIPVVPFKMISPQQAPFCKEVMPYFAAKKYCDYANIQPSAEQLEACKKDKVCEKITYKLQKNVTEDLLTLAGILCFTIMFTKKICCGSGNRPSDPRERKALTNKN